MLKSLKKLKAIVKNQVQNDHCYWYFDSDNDLRISEIKPFFNLTAQEIEAVATTSCGCQLWSFRALGKRLGVPVPELDWVWYNVADTTLEIKIENEIKKNQSALATALINAGLV